MFLVANGVVAILFFELMTGSGRTEDVLWDDFDAVGIDLSNDARKKDEDGEDAEEFEKHA